MKYTQLPADAFSKIALNAGVLLSDYTPGNTTALDKTKIIGVTSGGINFTATPSFVDFGEDIDNCPKNTMELKRIDSWDVKLSGTFATVDTTLVKRLIGAADIDGTDTTKITPRMTLSTASGSSDFEDIWFVTDYSDKTGNTKGGYVAIHMLNGLSTGGFQAQSTDKEKEKFSFEFTGHYSISDVDTVPFEVYVAAGAAET